MKRHLNAWHKDRPDHRDIRLNPHLGDAPPPSDLRAKCPPIKDQSQLGACTAFATTFLWWFEEVVLQGKLLEAISELRAYFWTRFAQGTVNQDSGGSLRGAMKANASKGLTHESLWPYDIRMFKKKPSANAERDGAAHMPTGKMYAGVSQDANSLRHVLAQGRPIAFGFSVPQSFMTQEVASSGVFHGPMKGEPVVGGHAVALVGYFVDAAGKAWYWVRNSWGTGWGQSGYFQVPASFIEDPNWCSDFWCVIGGPAY